MDVKDAVRIAKSYVADIFMDKNISHIGLEEVEYEDSKDVWRVTIGFQRSWKRPVATLGSTLSQLYGPPNVTDRWYKTLEIGDQTRNDMSPSFFERCLKRSSKFMWRAGNAPKEPNSFDWVSQMHVCSTYWGRVLKQL